MGLFFSDSHKGEGRIRHNDLDKHLRSLGISREHRASVIDQFREHTAGREHITGEDIDKVIRRMKKNSDDGIDERHVTRIHEHLLDLVRPVEQVKEPKITERPTPKETQKPESGAERLNLDIKK